MCWDPCNMYNGRHRYRGEDGNLKMFTLWFVIIFFQQICFPVEFLRRMSKPISFPKHTSKWVGQEAGIEYLLYRSHKCHNEQISIWGLLISASPSIAHISFYSSQCVFQKGSPALSSLTRLGQSTKRNTWKPHKSSKTSHSTRSHFRPPGSLLSHEEAHWPWQPLLILNNVLLSEELWILLPWNDSERVTEYITLQWRNTSESLRVISVESMS